MPPKLDLIVNHNRDLIDAGRHGELGRLRALLAGGADASAADQYGSTPLHAAASWNDRAVAELLLNHGADVNARDWEGATPLLIAAAFGDKAMIGLLLDRGADVGVRDDTGWTPLHVAARLGRVEEVGFLVSRGADAGARNQDGRTPLEVALSTNFQKDRREPLGRLLGEAIGPAEARHSLPSPGDIADGERPRSPGHGPERGKGRGR
jgi:ankyrin repeat protein